jgi:hypothetical protein
MSTNLNSNLFLMKKQIKALEKRIKSDQRVIEILLKEQRENQKKLQRLKRHAGQAEI